VLPRLSTTVPEHEYSERMTFVCECGFDYRQASALRAKRGMFLARFVRCVLNAHPKNPDLATKKEDTKPKTESNVSNFGSETDVMIITLLREWKSAQLIKHHRSWPCCRRTEAIMEIEPVAVGDRALGSDREGSGSFIYAENANGGERAGCCHDVICCKNVRCSRQLKSCATLAVEGAR